jgi:hypothetical protein
VPQGNDVIIFGQVAVKPVGSEEVQTEPGNDARIRALNVYRPFIGEVKAQRS